MPTERGQAYLDQEPQRLLAKAADALRNAAGRCAEAGEHVIAKRLRREAEDMDRKARASR